MSAERVEVSWLFTPCAFITSFDTRRSWTWFCQR